VENLEKWAEQIGGHDHTQLRPVVFGWKLLVAIREEAS
jgi:hypothetical protein